MSLKFLFSNVDTFHSPTVDGYLPHCVPKFCDDRTPEIIFRTLFRERRLTHDLAVCIAHRPIVAFLEAKEQSRMTRIAPLVADQNPSVKLTVKVFVARKFVEQEATEEAEATNVQIPNALSVSSASSCSADLDCGYAAQKQPWLFRLRGFP
jgi:hypothetical protein